MPNTTPNLGLNTFLENDVFDYNQLNSNFSKIDNLDIPGQTGTMTSTYSYVNYNNSTTTGEVTWRFRRYKNKVIELNTVFTVNMLSTNNGTSPFYYSKILVLNMPVEFAGGYDKVYDINTSLLTEPNANYFWRSAVQYYSSYWPLSEGLKLYVVSNGTNGTSTHSKTFYVEVKGVEK